MVVNTVSMTVVLFGLCIDWVCGGGMVKPRGELIQSSSSNNAISSSSSPSLLLKLSFFGTAGKDLLLFASFPSIIACGVLLFLSASNVAYK